MKKRDVEMDVRRGDHTQVLNEELGEVFGRAYVDGWSDHCC